MPGFGTALPANYATVTHRQLQATLLVWRDLPADAAILRRRYCWYSWSVLAAMMKSLRWRLRILWVHQVT